ncbi:MAG TPA: long-chain-acyl-CoA synthetase [Steroidobacteraceae bacterium]|jgi:fatty-acyl-CoA synthase|nr:long-chain-acyl-CoA synthetase [Steroidobacteraceae bacterium]
MAISVTQPGEIDSKFARDAWLRALAKTAGIGERGITLPVLIETLAGEFAAAPALISVEASMTFRELGRRCNQYSRWGVSQDLKSGDSVALLMSNCAEYLATWLGLTRIGVVVALVNSQLAGEVLAHSIKIAHPKLLIVGADLAPRVAAIRALLPRALACRVLGPAAHDIASLTAELDPVSDRPLLASEHEPASIDATALYIYTSGTTGLPKAAKVSHYRLMQWSHWFAGLMDTRPDDRMFNCLPLYHSVGGVVATFATLVNGGAVVIRPRFSASEFWRDVREQHCTLFQYIGELCRYLLNSPHQPIETGHSLRIACGNGLRPEVWLPFQSRFRIPRILEYYASTEGNFSLYNCEGHPGAIGRIPPFLASRLPVALLRFDVEKSEPWRNADGLCERCAANEVGEAVGLMPGSAGERAGRFEGYADPEASNRKVLRDVFEHGDSWYRTGDLMRRDERGFYYFVDRVGETYRWKGENVSTAEVLGALTASRGVTEGVVYGVAVPGTDGRAGMAALVVDSGFDLAAFRTDVASRLPPYARPVFLRLLTALEATGTFKPRKQELAQAGFDPGRTGDPLYFDDPRSQRYVPLDARQYAAIADGRLRI